MREHPIPQDVVGYRFHIIGNMTIKQFGEIGLGCVIAFFIYTTNLFVLIKWPLIGLSIGLGALAAFVPFEERPLDHWLVTFVKVMYRPTLFFWKREPKIPEAFLYTPSQSTTSVVEIDLTPARRQRIKDYLGSLDLAAPPDQMTLIEQSRLQEIMLAFQTYGVTGTQTPKAHRPSLTVRTHSLKEPTQLEQPTEDTQVLAYFEPEVKPIETFKPKSTQKQILDVHQVASSIEVPELETISLESPVFNSEETTTLQASLSPDDQRAYSDASAPTLDVLYSSQPAALNADLPFPVKPTEPNKLVGMVLTPQNELINDAIVEIRTEQGLVARAVKTNALGQFFVTTPLANGSYTLSIDKEGYQFTPTSITLTGAVVEPVELRSI